MNYWIKPLRLLPILLGCATPLYAQVDIEAYRQSFNPKYPHQLELSTSSESSSDTSQHYEAKYNYQRHKKTYRLFLVSELEQSVRQGTIYADHHLVHLRLNRKKTKKREYEHFIQTHSSDTQSLNNRSLVGSGLRWTLVSVDHGQSGIYFGTGIMLEREDYRHLSLRSLIRSTNYIAIHQKVRRVLVTHTIYYQPHLGDFSDYRILNRSKLTLPVSPSAHLSAHYNLSYKSVSPSPMKEIDSDLGLNLGVKF